MTTPSTRPAARSFRLGRETDAELDALAARLRLGQTDVIRQAVRRLHAAEFGPKKSGRKSPTGIASGNTRG